MSDGTEPDDLVLVTETRLKRLETHIRGLEQTVQQQRVDNFNLESQVTGLESQVTSLEQTVHQQRVDNTNLESQVTSLEQTVQRLTVDNTKLKSQLEIYNSKLKQSIAKNNVQMNVLQNDLHKLQHDLNASTTGEMIKDI